MKLGISSYTYTWAVGVPGSLPIHPMKVNDLIDRAASLGVDTLQVADNLPLEVLTNKEQQELYKYASGKKITLEMGGRGLTPEHTMKCLLAAETFQSPLLRMVIDKHDFEPDIPTIIGIIRDLLPEFKSRRIPLAIENHDRIKACDFEKIVLSVHSEWVGICLDSVNSMGAGEGFETVSETLLPYTFNLHLKDFSIQRVSHKMGFIIEGKPAGQGMLNIKTLIEKLNKSGNCRSAILELWTPWKTTLEETIKLENQWANESIQFLKPLFNQ